MNILRRSVTKEYLKRAPAISGIRVAIVLVMSLSWFALVNHCELAAATLSKPAQPHSCCDAAKAPGQSPVKDNDRGGIECCKGATPALASIGKPTVSPHVSFVPPTHAVVSVASPEASLPVNILELDTGPPFASSFAEVVLQRSILAHAPPV